MRDPKKIPKNPHTKCSNPNCDHWINIKRSKLINFLNYQKITNWKNVRKKVPIGKNVRKLEILKMLDQGLYAQEISQKISLSQKNLSRIINSFKERGLIIQIQSYPKIYQITNRGRSILAQGDLSQTRIDEYIPEREDLPKGILHLRVHKLRFKNELIQKPTWLNQIRNTAIINGLTIKKVELKNWNKFLIFFNYQDFNGLEKIEVCNNVIIYNFMRKKQEQFVFTKTELEDYLEARISDCKDARTLLLQKGFEINNRDPDFCQNPSYAAISNGDPNALGSLGKQLILTVKTPTEVREVDDSPKTEKGEEETDDLKKAKSYLDMPNTLENINTRISNIENAMRGMVDSIKEMTRIFSNLANQSEQTVPITQDSGGMFQ